VNQQQYFEILGALLSIGYSLLLMKENKTGWLLGIASSCISVWLFYQTQLFAQAIISVYFALVGIYGYWYWHRAEKHHEHIHIWPVHFHPIAIITIAVIGFPLASIFAAYTKSASPVLDTLVTVSGFIASIKEARKILSSWLYWFIINLASAWLYYTQHLNYYAILMVVYAGICIPGYISWHRIYQAQKKTAANR
jgi:nicotinamide mononucleotide transporter